jgi:hypothetical protein
MDEVRPQFRLVDILVLTALVAVLLAILMPVARYTRQPAKRMQCQNNLKNLVLAAHNFESIIGKLPANRQLRVTSTGETTVGWVYDLLPYIEQQDIYDRLKKDAADKQANQVRISLLICPNDPAGEEITATSYMVNGGCPNRAADNFDSSANGLGDDLAGSFVPRKRATSQNCKDGTSSTLHYVENCNARGWNEDFFHPAVARREYFHAVQWLPVSEKELDAAFQSKPSRLERAFLWGINEGSFDGSGPEFARPSSGHPGGFQAAFAGGNVRYISETIDYRIYAQLLSSRGAQTIDPADSSVARTEAVRLWQRIPLVPQEYE